MGAAVTSPTLGGARERHVEASFALLVAQPRVVGATFNQQIRSCEAGMLGRGLVRQAVALTALVAVATVFAAPNPGGTVNAQPSSDHPVVFIGGGAANPGGTVSAEIVVLLGPNSGLNEFEMTLEFDPNLVTVGRVTLDSSWRAAEPGPAATTPGKLVLAAVHTGDGCPPGTSCHLATVDWKGSAAGVAVVDATGTTLFAGGTAIPGVTVVPGRLQIGAAGSPRGEPLTPNTAVDGARASGPGARATGTPASSGLDSSLAAGLFLVLGMAVVLLLGGTLIVAVARKTWAWSRQRLPAPASPQAPLASSQTSAADEVSEYLSRIEAFGSVLRDPADEPFAEDVALAFARAAAPPAPTPGVRLES